MTPDLPSPSLTELHQPKHNLPTPIEVERLKFLLSGYNHSTAELLVSGFKFGFPIHYIVVLAFPVMQEIYCRHLKILLQ